MTYERLAYDDPDTALEMHVDCTACASRIAVPERMIQPHDLERVPSIEYDDFPREIKKPEITVDEATAHLAARLHLHLD